MSELSDASGDFAAIRRLHEHRMWVNALLLGVVGKLDDSQLRKTLPVGRGCVWDTLVHLYAAEYLWLEALQGNATPPGPTTFTFDSIEALRAKWAELDARWQRYLDALTPDKLGEMVAKSSTGQFRGRVMKTPVLDVLLHVCTHAQYTTAQLVNMLRQLGLPVGELPDTMLITLSRLEHADYA